MDDITMSRYQFTVVNSIICEIEGSPNGESRCSLVQAFEDKRLYVRQTDGTFSLVTHIEWAVPGSGPAAATYSPDSNLTEVSPDEVSGASYFDRWLKYYNEH